VIKLREGVVFVIEKNEGRGRDGRVREEDCSSDYKLNIIDRFNDGFKYVGNFVRKNNISLYFLAFYIYFFSL
jgi:hypothetical protein